MLKQEVIDAVARVRVVGTDLADVEVKRAENGFPQSTTATISAFSNGQGGLIILGLDESQGFRPVPINARAMADALATACRDSIEPPVTADIDIVVIDDMPVVAAYIPPGNRVRMPYFIRTQGIERGSYLRSYDGDRHLTTYEVQALIAGRGQPRDDTDLVPEARVSDLDEIRVASLVTRLRTRRGSVFSDLSDTEILELLQVIKADKTGAQNVTLAGLMALGRYPQRFFPQLNVTFVAFATVDGSPLRDGTRFLDNAAIDGPIPVMVTDAVAIATRNMTRRSVVVGVGRTDYLEYPVRAVRELIGNALMHRDYSPLARGSQVRVELYPDRLEIISPGGVFGQVDPQALGSQSVTSSRNSVLSRLLEDVELPGLNQTVCENRGSGLLVVSSELRQSGLEPAEWKASITEFRAVLHRETLFDQETITWLDALGMPDLDTHQKMVLAYLHRNDTITSATFRALTGCDPEHASRDLAALVGDGLLLREETDRAVTWSLRKELPLPAVVPIRLEGRKMDILATLADGPLTTGEIAQRIGVSAGAIRRHLGPLEGAGLISATSVNKRSPSNSWELTQMGHAHVE